MDLDPESIVEYMEVTLDSFKHYAKGRNYRSENRLREALQSLTRSLELDPMAMAFAERSYVFYRLGKPQRGIDDANRAIALDPDLVDGYRHRGMCYSSLGLMTPSLGDAQKALLLDPSAPNFSARGGIYYLIYRYGAAMIDFNRALELDPNHVQTIGFRGRLYVFLERYDEALADLNRRIDVFGVQEPTMGAHFSARAVCNCIKGNFEQGARDFIRAHEFDPTFPELGMRMRQMPGLIEQLLSFLPRLGNPRAIRKLRQIIQTVVSCSD